jgi:hypothetical protein
MAKRKKGKTRSTQVIPKTVGSKTKFDLVPTWAWYIHPGSTPETIVPERIIVMMAYPLKASKERARRFIV